MKKKELKKRINDLEQENAYLISDNVRLMMRLGGTCAKENERGGFIPKNNDKTEYMTQNGKLPNCEYVIDTNAAKRFVDEINSIKLPKTEGPESESELKENTISLEVGKKYMTKHGEILNCVNLTEGGDYQCEHRCGKMYYPKDGKCGGLVPSWDIVSEVKE